jgi:hypothetical protein
MTATISKPPAKVYRLRICPVGSSNDDAVRHLKVLLKAMLRRHGFRALTVEEEHPCVVSGRIG